jgi:hypothetical protein
MVEMTVATILYFKLKHIQIKTMTPECALINYAKHAVKIEQSPRFRVQLTLGT